MGAWGTAIFSDDTACDVRDDYREFLGDGLTNRGATDAVLREWQGQCDEAEMGVVWLSLAAIQWKCGRLEDRVKQQALRIIDTGTDLERWEGDVNLIRKRKASLAKLRSTLMSPQPSPRKIPKRFRDSCDWEIGELVAYRLLSGKWIIFRVHEFHSDRGGTSPTCEILDSVFDSIPQESKLKELGVVVSQEASDKGRIVSVILGRVRESELPLERIVRLRTKLPPVQAQYRATKVVLWRMLDQYLGRDFDFR